LPHQLINLSQYPAEYLEWEIKGRDFLVVIAKVCLDLKPDAQAIPSTDQVPLQPVDEPNTTNDLTSVRYEGDFVPYKPRADILCVGQAYAPGGRPVSECEVQFSVGDRMKSIKVVGDRYLSLINGNHLQLTETRPFTSMPLIYENAFGGLDPADEEGYRFYEYNPVGKGYCSNLQMLHGKSFPNLEDPKRPIVNLEEQHRPMGFGPIGYAWQPRIKHAGTYDDTWLESVFPDLPDDYDSGYYNCAPPDQQIEGYLIGDEVIQTLNMHADHPVFQTKLPGITIRTLIAKVVDKQVEMEDLKMNLDTCWVDMDNLKCILVWRGIRSCNDLTGHEAIVLAEESIQYGPIENAYYVEQLTAKAKEQQEVDKEANEAEAVEASR